MIIVFVFLRPPGLRLLVTSFFALFDDLSKEVMARAKDCNCIDRNTSIRARRSSHPANTLQTFHRGPFHRHPLPTAGIFRALFCYSSNSWLNPPGQNCARHGCKTCQHHYMPIPPAQNRRTHNWFCGMILLAHLLFAQGADG